MAYSRRNIVEEQQEARQNVNQIMQICEELHITLDPIDWQSFGMRAPVKVDSIEIADLSDLCQRDSDYILRRVQIKLFERAALKTLQGQQQLKALMWSPVEVAQPQEFLSLWVVTLENEKRIPIVEYLKDGQRIYEPYKQAVDTDAQLAKLFGPSSTGEYKVGEEITIKERDNQYTGKIIYIIPPGKASANRRPTAKGYHSVGGKTYTNETAARYIVDCNDGFPHIVNQAQVVKDKE